MVAVFSIFVLVVSEGRKPVVAPPFQRNAVKISHCARLFFARALSAKPILQPHYAVWSHENLTCLQRMHDAVGYNGHHEPIFYAPPLSGGIGSRQQKQRLRAPRRRSRPPSRGGCRRSGRFFYRGAAATLFMINNAWVLSRAEPRRSNWGDMSRRQLNS